MILGLKNSFFDRHCLSAPSSLHSTHLHLSYWQVSKFGRSPISILRDCMWKESLRKLLRDGAWGANMQASQVHRRSPGGGCLSALPWKDRIVLYQIQLRGCPSGLLQVEVCLMHLCTPPPLAVGIPVRIQIWRCKVMCPQVPRESVAAEVLLLAIDFSWRQSDNCQDRPKRDVYIRSELFRPVWKQLNFGVLIFEVCPGCGGTGRGQAEATTPAPSAETSAFVPSTRAGACPCTPRGMEIFEQCVLLCCWCLPPQNASETFSNITLDIKRIFKAISYK